MKRSGSGAKNTVLSIVTRLKRIVINSVIPDTWMRFSLKEMMYYITFGEPLIKMVMK